MHGLQVTYLLVGGPCIWWHNGPRIVDAKLPTPPTTNGGDPLTPLSQHYLSHNTFWRFLCLDNYVRFRLWQYTQACEKEGELHLWQQGWCVSR